MIIRKFCFLLLFVLAGCVGNVELEGGSEIAEKIVARFEIISRSYAKSSPEGIIAIIDPSLMLNETIKKDIDKNTDISFDLEIERVVLNKKNYEVHISWSRKWVTGNGNEKFTSGTTLFQIDAENLNIQNIIGDDPFSVYMNN